MSKIINGSVSIGGKCSDMGWFNIVDEHGDELVDKSGYMPDIENVCGGDYIEFVVDNATGRIVGWVPLTMDTVKELTGDDDEVDEDY